MIDESVQGDHRRTGLAVLVLAWSCEGVVVHHAPVVRRDDREPCSQVGAQEVVLRRGVRWPILKLDGLSRGCQCRPFVVSTDNMSLLIVSAQLRQVPRSTAHPAASCLSYPRDPY